MMLPVIAMGKPRLTQRDKWKQRPVVMRYRAYCDELRLLMPNYELPIELYITFYLPMPRTWSHKKRIAHLGSYHDQTPDIDNLTKGFMDAFKSEDKHVALIHATKYWADKGAIEIASHVEYSPSLPTFL